MRSSSHTHDRARALRRALSPPEAALWARLRSRRADLPTFRRQHPIGPYIADFYCTVAKLVIEIDGVGHGDDAQQIHDRRRDAYMRQGGYRILRVSAGEVMADPDSAAQGIVDVALACANR